ncbi:unnamed protein product [Rotaria magnacalcarata]|uniref:Uncharacterized protein n=2 Tax=Rotaria magnacalcarata TaxID=392030 RepID=A0A817A5J8_9BILA|nr:unnamed protein product [Rotaria magnacalcarata]CAF1643267.1 unnamed protein product [Rotaria magnacalcarata]CAF2140373.1 unnamed protein product [Rotaria magnacalcarata]CAF2143650.1 unnamed protein product [Rotaria magnacalcarata]CAF2244209.1 unnamed protein product [Rotaria magnacalcarata]
MYRLIFQRYLTIKTGQRGWRRYVDRLKERPASHITAFAILHELTAIIPFPLIYFPLKWSYVGKFLPIPIEYIQEGNKKINRIRTRYGFKPLDESSLVLVNLSMTYAIVKLILPLRIGLSLMLTPWLASIITRLLSLLKRVKMKFFS